MTSRAPALDGLRGFAAAAVAIYHAILHNDLSLIDRVLYQPIQAAADSQNLWAKIALTIFHGETAVLIFFVLSGTVLSMSLQRRDGGNFFVTAWTFARNRVLRLYPPLVVCLLLMFALCQFNIPGLPHWDARALLDNALLLSTPIHGPSATLQAEMLAVPLILAAWLLRGVFGVAGLLLAFVYSVQALQNMPLMFGMPSMHVYAMFFMGGMLVAEPSLRGMLQQVPARAWWLVLFLAVFGRVLSGHHGAIAPVITAAICCSFLVGGLLHGQRSGLHRFLEGRFAQALGRVSFSHYLYTVPVQFILWGAWTNHLEASRAYPVTTGILVGLLSLLIAYPLAWASERWIERPFASFGRGRARGWQTDKNGPAAAV
ncbi:acyltransferase family protein [Pseudoduganella sp. OTU4001]|uniref:acyltransferase family protein n=1 Tax=Pseudoduganella sp. OTU4001 TaxID=3043854 RepID=UPI00313EA5B3